MPFAVVKVTVGGQTFSTVADENGFYSIDIVSSVVEDLVLIEASADNPNDPGNTVDLVALTGTFSKLLSDPVENVTNLTTANFVLLVAANEGQPITSEAELLTAEKSVDATRLLQLAAVIKLIVDDPDYSIPEDENGDPLFDSLVDFVTDTDAVNLFIEDVTASDPINNDLTAMMQTIVNSGELADNFTVEQIPDRYFAIPAAPPDFMARDGAVYEFNPDFSGILLAIDYAGNPIPDANYAWSVVDGQLHIAFDSPPSAHDGLLTSTIETTTATPQQIEDFHNCAFSPFISGIVTRLSETFTLINDGALVESTQQDSNVVIDYDPIPNNCGPDIELADNFLISSTQVNLRDSTQITPVPFDNALVTGQWGIRYLYEPPDSALGAASLGLHPDLVDFSATGATSLQINPADTALDSWSIVDGRLVVSYYSGWTQTMTILDTNALNPHEYGVLYEVDDGLGNRSARYGLAVKKDDSFAFSEGQLVNPTDMFWNGNVNNWRLGPPFREYNGEIAFAGFFGWGLETGGIGHNAFALLSDENGDTILDRIWAERSVDLWQVLPDGRFRVDYLGRNRYWAPLAMDTAPDGARRIYVMEWEDVGSDRRINPRINIQWESLVPPHDILWQF
jgi:hypothetical protein